MTLTIDDFDYGRGFIPLPAGGRKRGAHYEGDDPTYPDQDRTWDEGEDEPDGDS